MMHPKDRLPVIKMRAIQKHLKRYAATRTRHFHQDVTSGSSSDASTGEYTEYAEQKIQQKTTAVIETAGEVARDSTRISYMKFKALREKRMASQTHSLDTGVKAEAAATDHSPNVALQKTVIQKHLKQKATRGAENSALSGQAPMQKDALTASAKTDTIKSSLHSKDLARPQKQQALYQKRLAQLKGNVIQQQAIQKHLEQNAKKAAEHSAAFTYTPLKAPVQRGRMAALEQLQRIAAAAWEKIRIALLTAAKAAGSTLIAFCGPAVAAVIVVLFIGIIAAILFSPISILFADESNAPGAIPIREIVSETNQEFEDKINALIEGHPECSKSEITYDYAEGYTWSSYWPEILALFAVDANLRSDSDVIVIDAAKKEQIQDIFWQMHSIEWEISEEEIPSPSLTSPPDPSTSSTPKPPEPVYEYTLEITVSSRSVEELAHEMEFALNEMNILNQLLSDELRPYLLNTPTIN